MRPGGLGEPRPGGLGLRSEGLRCEGPRRKRLTSFEWKSHSRACRSAGWRTRSPAALAVAGPPAKGTVCEAEGPVGGPEGPDPGLEGHGLLLETNEQTSLASTVARCRSALFLGMAVPALPALLSWKSTHITGAGGVNVFSNTSHCVSWSRQRGHKSVRWYPCKPS